MFAIALCLLLEADGLPPIEATDIHRFGISSRKQTFSDWQFINDHLTWGKRLRDAGTHREIDWNQWQECAYEAYRLWYVLDDVALHLDAKNEKE
jgi:hypothetical protein